ncbi:MAG: chromate transporter [Bacteroidales bacterium]|nr:chromate transporter [Bacteroidales bacterium]
MIFLQLFWTFFVIGAFTIGGGYAMLSLIESQVVSVHGWLTEAQFTDIVAISQMTPGPIGINTATYVGYSVVQAQGAAEWVCILGSLASTFAIMLPSFLIMMAIVRLYEKLRSNGVFAGVMSALRPAVVGLIGAAAVVLVTPENFIDWKSWALFAVAFVLSMWTKLSPILIIIGAGVAGYFLY